jgi:nitrite reductase/ring-hydroxylating ferredoxin subunit
MRFYYKDTNYFKSKYLYLAKYFERREKSLKDRLVTRIMIFAFLWLFFSCSDNSDEYDQILPNVPVEETVFLNNPEFINLQIVGGWAYSKGGISGIIVYHSGINNYVAFDRAAPHIQPKTCSKMYVKDGLFMVCPCDESQFSILNGAPLTEGIRYAAKQYRVIVMGNTLRITNF